MAASKKLDGGRHWNPVAAVAFGGAALLVVAVAFAYVSLATQLLHQAPAPDSAAPLEAGTEPAAPGGGREGPAVSRQDPSAPAAIPAAAPAPAPEAGAPGAEVAARPAAAEQRVFRSRRALETLDPREVLRQAQAKE